MASYNKIIMMGNLTRDPQLSYLPSQTPVVEFGLATNHKYKGADGQMKEDPCFVDCRMYGKRAEVISKYCKKGAPLLVEGRLTLDRWESQDGGKRSKHRIFVENFSFVGSGGGGMRSGGTNEGNSGFQDEPAATDGNATDFGGGGDDIPF